MALQECGLNLDRGAKELQPHGSIGFPCAGYSSHHIERAEDAIPWHWHEEIEIIWVAEGQLRLKTPASSFLLSRGQTAAVNSNTLHYAAAAPECTLHSLVFSPLLITGNNESAFAGKYIRPLLSSHSFSGFLISEADNPQVSGWFNRAFEALANDEWGYEFIVRENLSRICLCLYRQFEPQMDAAAPHPDQDNLRIRKMLDFLHEHFACSLSLKEIAGAADISERECLRCFQKMLQVSPIQYLLKYRIMQGAKMLLADPSGSISEAAADCGFDSPSNFTKMFRRFYNCTPREYRRMQADGGGKRPRLL